MPDAPIEQLVRAAQQGDRAAIDELLERYRPRLLRMIHCRLDPSLQPRLDESDIVQETLALASRDLSRYRRKDGVPFFAWLRRIAWHQLLQASQEHIDAEKRSVLREYRWGDDYSRAALAAALAIQSTPSGKVAEQELVTQITAALETLSDADHEVLVLRFLEGLTTAEAAAVAGITVVALRKRLTRALKRLKMVMEAESIATKRKRHEGN